MKMDSMGAMFSPTQEDFGVPYDNSLRECISQKLNDLSKSTEVVLELVNILFEKGLITDEEHQVFQVMIILN